MVILLTLWLPTCPFLYFLESYLLPPRCAIILSRGSKVLHSVILCCRKESLLPAYCDVKMHDRISWPDELGLLHIVWAPLVSPIPRILSVTLAGNHSHTNNRYKASFFPNVSFGSLLTVLHLHSSQHAL